MKAVDSRVRRDFMVNSYILIGLICFLDEIPPNAFDQRTPLKLLKRNFDNGYK